MSTNSSSSVSSIRRRPPRPVNMRVGLKRAVLSLHDQAVELLFPESVEADIQYLFSRGAIGPVAPSSCITVEEHEEGRFCLRSGDQHARY